jgi:hypothetical protein
MKGFCFKYFVLFLLLLPDALYAQTSITVTRPRLEISDNNLIIQYDILNTKSSDFFIIWVEVTDAKGNKIKALSVNGDVGHDIKGGKNKRITWNFINDSIFIDEDLFVEVKAEKVVPQEEIAEIKTEEETKTQQNTQTIKEAETKEENLKKDESKTNLKTEPDDKTKTIEAGESSSDMKGISKGKMVLTSVVLPGWGQTKIKNGKPFWLIGAAGYGCIAGSVLLNRIASSAYDDYKSSMDLDESNSLFDKATKRNNFSKVLGYSAIGIWAADLIWVMVTPGKSRQSPVTHQNRKLKITPGFDVGSNIGIVSLTYSF